MAKVIPGVTEFVDRCSHDAQLLDRMVQLAEMLADRRRRERDLQLASQRYDSRIQIV